MDAAALDAGSLGTDAGRSDGGGVSDAGPSVTTLHQLNAGASNWTVSPADALFRGPSAPRVEDIETAWSLCDFGMFCVGTATQWYCTPDFSGWVSGSWSSIAGAAPGFTHPTFTIATRERSGVARRVFFSTGAAWWQYAYSAAPADGSWALTLETHSMASGRMDHDVEWGRDANAPHEASRIVADWLHEETNGDARWNLVRDDGYRYQFFLSADGSVTSWETPIAAPSLALPGAPSIGRVSAMIADCEGTLYAIQRP